MTPSYTFLTRKSTRKKSAMKNPLIAKVYSIIFRAWRQVNFLVAVSFFHCWPATTVDAFEPVIRLEPCFLRGLFASVDSNRSIVLPPAHPCYGDGKLGIPLLQLSDCTMALLTLINIERGGEANKFRFCQDLEFGEVVCPLVCSLSF